MGEETYGWGVPLGVRGGSHRSQGHPRGPQGCPPRPWGPPHLFPGLLVPLLPTVATLGLVDSMERGEGGPRQTAAGGWRPYCGPISSSACCGRGRRAGLRSPRGAHPCLGAGPGIGGGVPPPNQHRTIARPATVTLGALLSVPQPWKRGSRGLRAPTKHGYLAFISNSCVPGSAAAKGSQPCGVGGHQGGLPGGGWHHQRASRLYPLAQARLSSEASVSSSGKWGHFLLAGNEVRISLNNHSNVSCFFFSLIEV